MALVTQAAALCVIAALLGLVLRRSNPEITLLLALAAAAAARFLEMPSAEQREKVKEWLRRHLKYFRCVYGESYRYRQSSSLFF